MAGHSGHLARILAAAVLGMGILVPTAAVAQPANGELDARPPDALRRPPEPTKTSPNKPTDKPTHKPTKTPTPTPTPTATPSPQPSDTASVPAPPASTPGPPTSAPATASASRPPTGSAGTTARGSPTSARATDPTRGAAESPSAGGQRLTVDAVPSTNTLDGDTTSIQPAGSPTATSSSTTATATEIDGDGSSASSQEPPDVTSAVAAISDSWRVAGVVAFFLSGLVVALLISQARARGAHRRH